MYGDTLRRLASDNDENSGFLDGVVYWSVFESAVSGLAIALSLLPPMSTTFIAVWVSYSFGFNSDAMEIRVPNSAAIVAILWLFAGSAHAQGTSKPQVVGMVMPRAAGDIRSTELTSIALRLGALCIEPAQITLHIGDTLSLDSLVVTARDSIGGNLGRLRMFDSQLSIGEVLVSGTMRRYVGITEGSATMVIRFPRARWLGRADAPTEALMTITVVR